MGPELRNVRLRSVNLIILGYEQCYATRGVGGRGAEGVAVERVVHKMKYSSDERLAWAPSVSRLRRESVVTGLHLERSISNTTTLMSMGWREDVF